MVWSEIRREGGVGELQQQGRMEGVGKIEVERAIEARGDGRGMAVMWQWAAGEARRGGGSRHDGGRARRGGSKGAIASGRRVAAGGVDKTRAVRERSSDV